MKLIAWKMVRKPVTEFPELVRDCFSYSKSQKGDLIARFELRLGRQADGHHGLRKLFRTMDDLSLIACVAKRKLFKSCRAALC